MRRHVIALCGGVGGAKLVFGLTRILAPEDLTVIVNTGDDFRHLGLHVSPDIDTVTYTLAGLSDRERGWGLAGETWGFMSALRRLGGEDWFQLGDHDLAMHIERSRRLDAGERLSTITEALTARLGVRHRIIPMTDDPVGTVVVTDAGDLPFQRYFVAEQCRPTAVAIRYEGAAAATPSAPVQAALQRQDVAAVVICPSNPYLSIDPILAVPSLRDGLRGLGAPIVAVSPIVGGRALKGPAAKLMAELGGEPGVAEVAAHYEGLIDGLVIDDTDAEQALALQSQGLPTLATGTIMESDSDRVRLAQECLGFAEQLSPIRR